VVARNSVTGGGCVMGNNSMADGDRVTGGTVVDWDRVVDHNFVVIAHCSSVVSYSYDASEVLKINSSVRGVKIFELNVKSSVFNVVASIIVKRSKLFSVKETVSVSIKLVEQVFSMAVRIAESVAHFL